MKSMTTTTDQKAMSLKLRLVQSFKRLSMMYLFTYEIQSC